MCFKSYSHFVICILEIVKRWKPFTMRNNPAFVVIFRMYGLFQTTFYFGYMALFSIGLGIMCGKLCSWLLALKRIDIVRRSYMFITFGKYNFSLCSTGTFGYAGASAFVKKIYSTVKIDWREGNLSEMSLLVRWLFLKQYRTIIFVFIGIKKFRAYVETRRAKRYYRSVLKFPLKLRMIWIVQLELMLDFLEVVQTFLEQTFSEQDDFVVSDLKGYTAGCGSLRQLKNTGNL